MAVRLGVANVGMPNSGISGRLCLAIFNPPPPTKEAVIDQARRSLWSVLRKSLRRRSVEPVPIRKFKQKQKNQKEQSRLRVEIPIGNRSEKSVAGLLLLLLEDARVKNTGKVCVVLRSQSLRDGVMKEIENVEGGVRVLRELQLASLEEGDDFEPEEDVSLVLFVAPQAADLAELKRYVASCSKRDRVLVLLNPEWNSAEEEENRKLLDTFQVVYAYTPLDIKVFFVSLIKGAVFKQELNEPWRVFLKENDTMRCMLSMQRRPTETDLQPILYNFLAANSLPVRFTRFVKGIFQKKESG